MLTSFHVQNNHKNTHDVQQALDSANIPSLKYCETASVEETVVLLRVMRLISPSLLIKSTSSVEFLLAVFIDVVVVVMESVNCFGVRDPVFERVRIRRVSIPVQEDNLFD